MFDMFKQMNQLRKMQEVMKQQRASVEREGVSVTLDGTLRVLSVVLSSQLPVERQADIVKDCFNEAAQKIQSQIAQDMARQEQA